MRHAKVLIADKFEKTGIDAVVALGCDVVSLPEVGAAGLPAAVGEHAPDVLIVRSTKVRAAVFEKAGRLGLIIRAGAGVDNIDVEAASARGVWVTNCPGKNSLAVAELAWGLILACDRRIADNAAELRAGKWNKKEFSKARGLAGRTLGVIGLGGIGRAVADRGLAFGMKVLVHSLHLTDEQCAAMGFTHAHSLMEMTAADVISVNVSGAAKLIRGEFFDALKPGTIFVNTSRGSVIDEPGLLRALERGVRAGLDVFENEPAQGQGEFRSALAQHPGVIGTHHIGASTDQAQAAIAEETVRILREYLEGRPAPNVINREARTPAIRLLTVTHQNKPGVLARVLGALAEERVNIEEMENTIFQGGKAACARMRMDSEPSPAALTEIARRCPEILAMTVTPID